MRFWAEYPDGRFLIVAESVDHADDLALEKFGRLADSIYPVTDDQGAAVLAVLLLAGAVLTLVIWLSTGLFYNGLWLLGISLTVLSGVVATSTKWVRR